MTSLLNNVIVETAEIEFLSEMKGRGTLEFNFSNSQVSMEVLTENPLHENIRSKVVEIFFPSHFGGN